MHPKRLEHRLVRQRERAWQSGQSDMHTSRRSNQDSAPGLIIESRVATATHGLAQADKAVKLNQCLIVGNERVHGDEEDKGAFSLPGINKGNRESTERIPSIFSLTVELFSDKGAKSQARIRLVSGPLELVYSPRSLVRIGRIFEYPNDLGLRMENAVADLNSLSSLEARAKAKLEFAMSNHARADIDVRAWAPVIIIPEQIEMNSRATACEETKDSDSVDWNSMDPPLSLEEDIRLLFICDLGRFHVCSQ